MVAGLLLLVVSPLFILVGMHRTSTSVALRGQSDSTSTAADAALAARYTAPVKVHLLPPRDPSLSGPQPTATPPPPPPHPSAPPAAPAATPKPVVQVAAAPPSPAGPPPSAGTIQAIIYAAATKYGVSYPWMLKIARCESGLNPRAYNPAGPYIGLFQFLPSTFRAHGGTNIYDPVQQSNIAANMLAHGGAGSWGCA